MTGDQVDSGRDHARFEVKEDRAEATWRVEDIDYREGECRVAIFFGNLSLERATEYAAWMNSRVVAA